MATTAMDYEPSNGDRDYDEAPRGEYRDQRSASPRRDDGHEGSRRRSASPAGNGERERERAPKDEHGSKDDDGAVNPGSNLFVTGIHPRLTEQEVTRLFEKYGEVEKCQIMRDPHTKESRGFGFVKMVTSDQADAAKDGLQGEMVDGRTFSIEKARRARPRTPTPGKYFGPPKREDGGGGRGGRFDRFDDRRRGGYGGGGGGYGGRDDPYRYRGYERRYDDRGGYDRPPRDDRGYDRPPRDDRGYRGDRDEGYGGGRVDRYGGGREDRDRYGGRDDRRGGGGGGGGYDRDREGGRGGRDAPGGGYGESAPRGEAREAYGGSDRNAR